MCYILVYTYTHAFIKQLKVFRYIRIVKCIMLFERCIESFSNTLKLMVTSIHAEKKMYGDDHSKLFLMYAGDMVTSVFVAGRYIAWFDRIHTNPLG